MMGGVGLVFVGEGRASVMMCSQRSSCVRPKYDAGVVSS